MEPLVVGAFVNRDVFASFDLLTLGMLEKALLPISSWPLSELAGNKRNKCSKLRSAAIGLLSLARRVSSSNYPSTGLLKAEPKRVVRGEELKPDSRPSRSLPATLLTSLGEVELKKLWQNKLLQNQQLLNPGRRTTGSGSSYLISSGQWEED